MAACTCTCMHQMGPAGLNALMDQVVLAQDWHQLHLVTVLSLQAWLADTRCDSHTSTHWQALGIKSLGRRVSPTPSGPTDLLLLHFLMPAASSRTPCCTRV